MSDTYDQSGREGLGARERTEISADAARRGLTHGQMVKELAAARRVPRTEQVRAGRNLVKHGELLVGVNDGKKAIAAANAAAAAQDTVDLIMNFDGTLRWVRVNGDVMDIIA